MHMTSKTCLITGALMLSGLASAQEGAWSYQTGIDYSEGDYGFRYGGEEIDTTITYIPFTVNYRGDLWTFDASFSHITIDGPGSVLPGEGIIRDLRLRLAGPDISTESGLGDIWLGASRFIESVPAELFYLDLGAKVKIPLADEERGLGTGVTDYSFQADFYKPIGAAMPFLTLAYKVRGDFDDVRLDNVLAVSAGSDFTLSENTRLGLSLDFQQAAYSDADDSLELLAYLNQQLNPRWGFMLYGYSGLKDGSPDYGVGLQLSYSP